MTIALPRSAERNHRQRERHADRRRRRHPRAEKNNTIGGNLTISGVTPEWLGVLFSHIAGNVRLTDITATDPEDDGNAAVSVVVNTVARNLNCTGLGPRLSGGAIPGEVNFVGHNATGQCAALV
jgi:hypothetical protein